MPSAGFAGPDMVFIASGKQGDGSPLAQFPGRLLHESLALAVTRKSSDQLPDHRIAFAVLQQSHGVQEVESTSHPLVSETPAGLAMTVKGPLAGVDPDASMGFVQEAPLVLT